MILYKLTIGYILDLLFGDPVWLYHPVRVIGKMIRIGERCLRKIFPKTSGGQLAAGTVLAVSVPLFSFLIARGILFGLGQIHPALAFIVETFWCYQILAGKCLKTEAMKVAAALNKHNLPLARKRISWLVGRDTRRLSPRDIIRAAVETVAENTTDGVIAPMIFMAIGGAPLGFAYKAVNTLDSMVGYRNEKYILFGRASAKLDDLWNFIPARISGILMIVSAFLCGYDGKGAVRVFHLDRNKHLSPNSAQTESVCAGALGICLGGTHQYFGKPVVKPTIGEPIKAPVFGHIQDACILMSMTGILAMFMINGSVFFAWLISLI